MKPFSRETEKPMLETLDTIDWAHIHHAHGTCEAFPKWIRQLRSPDPEVRATARRELFTLSHLQGIIYEVTPFLVPFLVELLSVPKTQERAALVEHLGLIAAAVRAGQSGGVEQAAGAALQTGLHLFLGLLSDPDPEVRRADFMLVTALGDAGPLWVTVNKLLEVAGQEREPEALAAMIRQLAQYVYLNMPNGPSDAFGRQMSPLLTFLTGQLSPDCAPRVQFQAALAHLSLIGGAQPDVLVDLTWVLGDVLAHPEKYSLDLSSFMVENTMKEALYGLEYLPRAWRMAILAEALPEAKFAGDAHVIGYALLETLFFGTVRTNEIDRRRMRPFLRRARLNDKDAAERPENSTLLFRVDIREQSGQLRPPGRRYVAEPLPADLAALSDTERRMLRLVLDTDLVWMLHSNLLAVYGLPVERHDARALLDEADAANSARVG